MYKFNSGQLLLDIGNKSTLVLSYGDDRINNPATNYYCRFQTIGKMYAHIYWSMYNCNDYRAVRIKLNALSKLINTRTKFWGRTINLVHCNYSSFYLNYLLCRLKSKYSRIRNFRYIRVVMANRYGWKIRHKYIVVDWL